MKFHEEPGGHLQGNETDEDNLPYIQQTLLSMGIDPERMVARKLFWR